MDELLKWSQLLLNLSAALVSLGVVSVLMFAVKYLWERFRWRAFARQVERWARDDFRSDDYLPDQLRALTANWLSDAGFTAKESKELLDIAVTFARARIDFAFRGEDR